ncbi:LysM peptidoglycan-binding domain-containing protein [Emticicia sp.]|uniref:LysM peptidoglycan-binding domain-containing protein n=1 Tax=Emticicia sp. TaxID=1930953 RepID=UPI0037523BBB
MLRYFCLTAVFVLFLTNAFSTPLDSLGIEKKNGKTFVQHKVEQGETLYSILKRYNCSEKDFFEANTSFKKGDIIGADQVIEVPIKGKTKSIPRPRVVEIISATPTETRPKGTVDQNGIEIVDVPEATPKETEPTEQKQPLPTDPVDSSKTILTKKDLPKKVVPAKIPLKGKNHVVMSGENLFAIAKSYGLKAWQLREWNNLKTDALRINQVLIVEKPVNFVAKTVKKDTLKPKPVQIQAPAGDVGKEKSTTIIHKPVTNKPQAPVPNAPGGKKFSEQGIAEVIDAGATTNKFLALHRTAPVGTLIKVANQANGQSVWVKVIGKLSSSGDVIIKVSPKAFEKLAPRDKRIRAELSYSVSN